MTDPRKIEFDIEALILSAGCIFLWSSLLSYDPADSLGEFPTWFSAYVATDIPVYPPNEAIQNRCGWFGALVAHLMIQALGISSILIATGLSVLAIWMFRVQSNYVTMARQLGWVLIVIASTTFLALLEWNNPLSPVIGAGGYLGKLTSLWLNQHFAWVGSLILTLTALVSGVLLSTDYYVVRAIARALQLGTRMVSTAAVASKDRVGGSMREVIKPRHRRSDVDDGVQLDAGDPLPEPTIRFRGKSANGQEAAPEESSRLWAPVKKLRDSLLPDTFVLPSPRGESKAVTEEDEQEFEPERLEAIEEATEPAEFREFKVEEGTVQVRADNEHETPAEPAGPRVRAPRGKKKVAEASQDSLAHLDDTKLPIGSEEYVLPGLDMLDESDDIDFEQQTVEVRRKAKILESTFKDFGFNVRVVEIETGPVIAQYEIELEAGLRLSKITGLADDLAIALRVPSVRIVAPIPGKNTVGIEVPNETRQVVRIREVIEEQSEKGRKSKIPLFLGKDVSGNALTADLATLPHLLIAGRTGTGKSVCLNAIIASILMTRRPDEVRMLMIDPKMVELSGYGRLPHLMHPVVTDMKKAEAILAWAVDKMEERYSLLAKAGVRHLTNYNELGREELIDRLRPESEEEAEAIPDHLPFIVIVADEMADLMMTAGKEVEQHIIRLAQKSRAVGIHLILATQKPTVDVITGLIKSNLPARISFQVASRTDSRVVLDEMGAEKLLGNGDMLFLWPGTSMLLRGQGTYLSDEEINCIVDHCSTGEQNFVNELVNLKIREEEGDEPRLEGLKKRDDLYAAAVEVVVQEGRGSCSLLQRALGIGYGRAARLIDFMAEDGIVGEYAGSQAREVLISSAEWTGMQAAGESDSGDSTPAQPHRSNKIRPHDDDHATPTSRISGSLPAAVDASPTSNLATVAEHQADDPDQYEVTDSDETEWEDYYEDDQD